MEITSKEVRGNNVDFSIIKLHRKKVVEATWIFRPAQLHGKTYVETTWIFRSVCGKKYVEMTLKFVEIWASTYRCNIDVEST